MSTGIPTIETPRLILRPLHPDDAADIFSYATNPVVLRFTTAFTPSTLVETREYVKKLLDKPPGSFTLAMVLKENQRVVGVFEFFIKNNSFRASIDYSMAEELWNRGFMTEAAKNVIDWGFQSYPELKEISAAIMPENTGSIRVMEKCGLDYTRRKLEKWAKNDAAVELVVYTITREKWANL